MSDADDFASVRRDPDPIRRGRRATELLTTYQQRATELARLRKAAIEEAHRERGMTYTEIATALGITKGRVTQIRSSAPGPERALFGVGPVAIGVPYRYQTTDRERPLIAAEDARSGEQVEQLLEGLGFAWSRFQIAPETDTLPESDAVVICGPKSSPLAEQLLDADPVLQFVQTKDGWHLQSLATGNRHHSPSDRGDTTADLAYVARHRRGEHSVLHIAGIHAIGSLAAVHYLSRNLDALFRGTGDAEFSLIVRGDYEDLTIADSELVAGPYLW
jgi:transcriptional regulator with XRE-family HTH domain